ncbi:MAG: sigma-54-dependent Fis family transcriptional regulator [Gammaproteobacteria bacterium]|nr:sigma-54-dependent Fis family transcriptional regulator [Gammaproteobacteria bacterium]
MTLKTIDIEVDTVSDVVSAKNKLKQSTYQVCLTDMRLPDGSGMEIVKWIQSNRPEIPVAMITAHGNVEIAVEALKAGAFDFVPKPVDIDVLRRLVSTASKLSTKPQSSDTTTTKAVKDLTGQSPQIQKVRELIQKVARSQAPVLILGESGTGKELVARLIHYRSPRNDNPFVPVNCGAIPSELMESEFFGHKKGSFTGAVADKKGLFQTADGGTLFLDEIAELPLHMQVKLLRVIQERAVRPVGANLEMLVDVRIVSATHKDLPTLISNGEFREDLFYRINVIELPVPPLRDRPQDIEPLAQHLLAQLAINNGSPIPTLSNAAIQKLKGYSFSGNVRELENTLERALTMSSGSSIDADDIVLRESSGDTMSVTMVDEGSGTLVEQLDEIERHAILDALEKTGQNKTKAAELLGISFRALRYRIKKLGIE